MPIPHSGPISFSMLRDEFGAPASPTGAIRLGDYYRGLWVPNTSRNVSVPVQGPISLASMRGASVLGEGGGGAGGNPNNPPV